MKYTLGIGGDGMNSVIFNPLEEYENKYRDLHKENTAKFFDETVKRSGIDIESNRQTVAEYNKWTENARDLRKKLNLLRFLRVVMIITLILIPVVILSTTPRIRKLREDVSDAEKKAQESLSLATSQMDALNRLFSGEDALRIIEKTIPMMSFEPCFTAKQESDMRLNYDFSDDVGADQSTIDVLAGRYNDNPFLFENRLIHTMGTETYHGYKTIHWTETYRDREGKLQTRTRSQTLQASVTKPKPFYSTQVVLNYCAQGGPDLCFSRDATHLERKSEWEIERYEKRGEKRLKKKTDKAIKQNKDFVSMSNSDFEVLFDALDRDNEVEFRTLFTPLAQTNMVDLLLSKTGYGDDFNFIKRKRTNTIISNHSQGRPINLLPHNYTSYSFDIVKSEFMGDNEKFFKDVYFDFAPLLAIPMYQERPVHSLKPIPDMSRLYSLKESESLANLVDSSLVVYPDTKTKAILKSSSAGSSGGIDRTTVTAYSYDIASRVDVVPVFGGDGRFHNVSVHWDEYLPLRTCKSFSVASSDIAKDKNVLARRNGLCIFNS